MAVPGVVLLIPKFLIIKQLGIYDTYSGMILPLVADAAGVFIMKKFFESDPGQPRGGGQARRGGRLPHLLVGRPARRQAGADHHHDHRVPVLVERAAALPRVPVAPETNTLTTGVAGLLTGALGSGNRYPLKLAAAVLMTIPVALMFFVFQKRIISGSLEGAVKE